MKKVISIVVVVALCLMAFAGCSAGSTDTSSTAPASVAPSEIASAPASAAPSETASTPDVDSQVIPVDKPTDKVTIGYSVYWMSEFSTLLTAGMQQKADELGVDLLFVSADSDSNKQIGQIENFITQGVDAIICAPVDRTAILPAIADAKAAGIPFVAVNMYVDTPDLTAYSGPNDVAAAEMATQAAIDAIGGKGNVIVLDGGPGFSASDDRITGVQNILAANPDVKLLAEKSANWSTATAQSMMEDYIQNFGDQINAVICANDDMAMGVLQALESKNITNVFVTGIDATKDACTAIKAGKMTSTVYQDANLEGGNAVALAVNLAAGKTVNKDNLIKMILVTKDNVDQYLAAYNK